MGQKRIELLQTESPITPAQMLDMQNNANQHVNNLVLDVIGEGVVSATIVPLESGVGVTISDFESWSSAGHGKQTAAVDINLASYKPTSGYKWISVFATSSWELGDYRPDYYGNNDYHKRTETVTFSVLQGSATVIPLNPGGGAVRVCSIRLHATTQGIVQGNILTGNGRGDSIVQLWNKVSTTGDNLTGTLKYNGKPVPVSNGGWFTFQVFPGLISGTGSEDFDGHYILTSGGWINTGIVSENLAVSLVPAIGFFKPDGSVGYVRVQPQTMRMHTDYVVAVLDATLTEGLYVVYEEDGNGKNTGRFMVYCLGTQHYCNRFAAKNVRWTAVAPQPVSDLS